MQLKLVLSPLQLRFRARRALGSRRDALLRMWWRVPLVRRRLKRRAQRALDQGSVAFVCFGNICRSPFAEGLIKQRLDGRHVVSAGYFPEEDRRSPELAIAAAGHLGVHLGAHRSRVLTDELVEDAEAIFVFDQENYRTVVRTYPSARRKVHFIGALADQGTLFVPDPYGGTAEEYESVYRRITELIGPDRPSARRD